MIQPPLGECVKKSDEFFGSGWLRREPEFLAPAFIVDQ